MSKNNGDIARLGPQACPFPGAAVVVPFRRPVDHVASLRRQHENLLRLQALAYQQIPA